MPHKAGSSSARRLLSKIPLTWWVSSFSLHIRIPSGVCQHWRFLGYLPHHSSWGAVPGAYSFHEHCRQLTAGSRFLRTLKEAADPLALTGHCWAGRKTHDGTWQCPVWRRPGPAAWCCSFPPVGYADGNAPHTVDFRWGKLSPAW